MPHSERANAITPIGGLDKNSVALSHRLYKICQYLGLSQLTLLSRISLQAIVEVYGNGEL
jgi:hypothetical protein